MLGQYQHGVTVATISTDTLVSTAIAIDGANRVAFEIPTLTGGITATANVFCQVAESATGTFRRIVDMGVYSASSGLQDWEAPSTTGNRIILCRPAAGASHVKIELSNTATANVLAKVHIWK